MKSSRPVRTNSENWMQVGQKDGLKELLDEMARAHQQDHLPFGPGGNVVGVQIDHADETELQRKPQQLDHDPKQEVAFKPISRTTELRHNAA
jgi:hypothetical protein